MILRITYINPLADCVKTKKDEKRVKTGLEAELVKYREEIENEIIFTTPRS